MNDRDHVPGDVDDRWRLVTWNVLAQAFCHPHRYADVDPDALEASSRRARVVEAVVSALGDVDVACLQEVDDGLVAALRDAGVGVHAVAHASRDDAVAVASRSPLVGHGGELGEGMSWAGAVLDAGVSVPTLVVSCHLRHPGDGPVGRAQAGALADQLRSDFSDLRWVVGADANAALGGPATRALSGLGLEVLQESPTSWINGSARATDVLALPPGGRLERTDGPLGPLPTPVWPSDHRRLWGSWPRR